MANALYGKAREKFLANAHGAEGTHISWLDDTIKVTLIDVGDYTVSIDTHEYMNLDTVPAAAKIATATLASKTATLGVADAGDSTFDTVAGDVSEALLIWKDGGDGGTTQSGTVSPLIAYIDSATGLPVTPNGGDIIISWDDGANKIFKL